MSDQPRPNLSTDEVYLSRARDLITGKGELEIIPFEYLTDAFAALGIMDDPYKDVTMTHVPEHTRAITEAAFGAVQTTDDGEVLMEKLYRLWDYLAGSDPLENADLIYVFGGISELAVREAIRLKKENFAPKILFSGKHGSYMKDAEVTEAEKYTAIAIEEGVSEADIIMEKESINTVENVVNSCRLLHEMNLVPSSIIAVSLPYHMKRASLTLRAGMDFDFRLIRHPGPSAKYSRETYFKDKNGWSYICNEFIKLYMARQGGHF